LSQAQKAKATTNHDTKPKPKGKTPGPKSSSDGAKGKDVGKEGKPKWTKKVHGKKKE
jgi:hypothetical protein